MKAKKKKSKTYNFTNEVTLTCSHHDDHGLFPVQPVYCEGQSLQTYSALDQKELVTIIDVDSYQPIIQVKVITYKQKNSNNSLANKSLISNFH